MAFKFPSEEWMQELSNQLNLSPSYEQSAKDWEGDFLFVVEPDVGLPNTVYAFLGLYHGKSTGATLLKDPNERKTEYTLSAPLRVWRQVSEGKLDPIQAMMTRKLKLSGNMMKIMRYPKAAQEIVACCTRIPTEYPE